MKLIIAEDYTELSRIAADIVENQVLLKPDSCLGTVTGGSPAGMYLELVRRSREEGLDLSEISVINTDEYAGLSGNHPQSYRYYLEHRFLDPCKIPGERAAVPRGDAGDLEQACRRYEAFCRSHPAELQILGMGHTGHIGFNEPEDHFPEGSHIVSLAPETMAANAAYFESGEQMPTQAVTVGIGTIMGAKRILLLVSGSSKAEITYRFLCGKITPRVPATILRFHPAVTAVIDKDALSVVREKEPERLDLRAGGRKE